MKHRGPAGMKTGFAGRLLLGEEKVVASIGPYSLCRGTTAIERPVPQGEDDDVGRPDIERIEQQRAAASRIARQDSFDQARQRAEIHQRHKGGQRNRQPAHHQSLAADKIPLLVC